MRSQPVNTLNQILLVLAACGILTVGYHEIGWRILLAIPIAILMALFIMWPLHGRQPSEPPR